jgi:hypothetical protein
MRFRSVLWPLCAVLAVAAVPATARAQAAPPAQEQTPAPAPAKPYKPVAIVLPKPMNDASFDAFRKRLGEIAQKKDRAGLARLLARDFFWESEDGDQADRKKSSIENLAKAIDLDAKDGSGWELLGAYAAEQTAAPDPDRKGVVCAPADPDFNEQQTEALLRETDTDPAEWVYPLADGVEVRETAQANSAVVEKLGLHFVRVMMTENPSGSDQMPEFVRVVTPSGKTGYVAVDQILPLGGEQLCYVKDASGWKIAGYYSE